MEHVHSLFKVCRQYTVLDRILNGIFLEFGCKVSNITESPKHYSISTPVRDGALLSLSVFTSC